VVGEDDDVWLDRGTDGSCTVVGWLLTEAEILDCMHVSKKQDKKMPPYLKLSPAYRVPPQFGFVDNFPTLRSKLEHWCPGYCPFVS
jgi:hypothetical protein